MNARQLAEITDALCATAARLQVAREVGRSGVVCLAPEGVKEIEQRLLAIAHALRELLDDRANIVLATGEEL